MKLAEGQRPGRLDLRPELRSVLDRIQGGEVIPRLTSPIVAESDTGGKSRGRTPRPERYGDRANESPRLQESDNLAMTEPPPQTMTTAALPPQAPLPAVDEFGAGLDPPSEP
jgi:hypothetical protein